MSLLRKLLYEKWVMNKKILVLEDEPDIREIIEYILIDSGYEVKTSANAALFLIALESLKPDLIIMDVMLPDGNGLDLCKKVKNNKTTSHIPIIIMSAHMYSLQTNDDIQANDFMPKPFDIDDMLCRIQSQLA